jgi:hypothetical protein
MTRIRILATAIILVEGSVFARSTQDLIIPVAVIALAILGCSGRIVWTITGRGRFGIALSLAVFVALWSIAAPYVRPVAFGLFPYPALTHAIGQFALAFQASQLFVKPAYASDSVHWLRWLRNAWGLRAAFPFYGLAVIIAAGDIAAPHDVQKMFQVHSLIFVLLTMLYLAASRQFPAPKRVGTPWPRACAIGVAALFALVLGALGSEAILRYGDRIDRTMSRLLYGTTQTDDIGFSIRANLGSVADMKQGNTAVALRIRSEEKPGYLRGMAYDEYRGGRWLTNTLTTALDPLKLPGTEMAGIPDGVSVFGDPPDGGAPEFKYQVWPAAKFANALFLDKTISHIASRAPKLSRNGHGVFSRSATFRGQAYSAYADATGGLSRVPKDPLLTVPDNLDPRVHRLAESIFKGAANTPERVARVVAYFHENYEYRLGITIPRKTDPMNYFLLEKPAAHCEYFASGAAILLRLAGVPCRYVKGFVADERHRFGDYWIARDKDAHAWVEAYDEDRGWVLVEATPAAGVPQATRQGLAAALLDYTSMQFRRLRAALSSFSAMRAAFASLVTNLNAHKGLLALILGLILAIIITLPLILPYLAGTRWSLRRRKNFPDLGPEPSSQVRALHELLAAQDRIMKAAGFERTAGETLHGFAARLQTSDEFDGLPNHAHWYRRYAAARFGAELQAGEAEDLQPMIIPRELPRKGE